MDRQLIEYLPPVLRDVREMRAILEGAGQAEVEALWNAAGDAFDDQFIWDATTNGVSRWEGILGIMAKASDSMSVRKFRIISQINADLPYTLPALQNMLRTLCGEDGYMLELDSDAYVLRVRVTLTVKATYEDVEALLRRIVPANMVIDLSLKFNTHRTLSRYKHEELAQYTHEQLRSEVLD